jgi:hypothetical protein
MGFPWIDSPHIISPLNILLSLFLILFPYSIRGVNSVCLYMRLVRGVIYIHGWMEIKIPQPSLSPAPHNPVLCVCSILSIRKKRRKFMRLPVCCVHFECIIPDETVTSPFNHALCK